MSIGDELQPLAGFIGLTQFALDHGRVIKLRGVARAETKGLVDVLLRGSRIPGLEERPGERIGCVDARRGCMSRPRARDCLAWIEPMIRQE